MSTALMFFLLSAIALVCLLVWALRPVETVRQQADAILQALTDSRHRNQLPQVLRALQREDSDFLRGSGKRDLAARIRRDRRMAALEYLDFLEAEYELLVEAMRILAAMSTELQAMEEWERFLALAGFAVSCKLLRWKLRAGLSPRENLRRLSETVSSAAFRVEQAATRVGERAFLATEMIVVREPGQHREANER